MELSSAIVKRLAIDTGFDACGLAEAAPVDPDWLDTYDRWLALGGHAGMHYLQRHRDLRTHPANLLPGAKTVIVLLLAYKSDTLIPHIAQYAYGEDYHLRLRRLLRTLAARLADAYPGIGCRPCVDSAPIHEKYWAVQAGLGWRGRNTLLVNPRFGSFVNLAELLVTLPADRYDCPLTHGPSGTPAGCPPGCHACQDACPNHALTTLDTPVSTLDAARCTAYNTIENRDPRLPDGLDTAGYAFGCDLCQLACPFNAQAPARSRLTPERRARLQSLATADEQQFKHLTLGTAIARINHSQWLRNLGKMI